ncbi:MAG TPA: SAM-dependent methyltransferase [Bacteroidota bacterium]|nr:SAM-dependent methyltransferase [Bacteroidota bacterium]
MNEHISETAVAIASLRALAGFERDAALRVEDVYAELFLPEDRRAALHSTEAREAVRQRVPPGMLEYVVARTRYFDAVYSNAVRTSVPQIVLLGAGFDSRPIRFPVMDAKTRIFETDMKATQQYKLHCLAEHGVAPPPEVAFIPVNFEADDVFEALVAWGFDQSASTLFLWEGVTFYLSQSAVARMLRNVKQHSGANSRLCFDFQTMRNNEDLIDTGLEREAIRFGITEGGICAFVEQHGFDIVEHVSAMEMEHRYLTAEDGRRLGNILPIMNFLLVEHHHLLAGAS